MLVASRPRARRRAERGAVAVEFALVFPVLAILLIGMLQFGWYFFSAQSASSAARETARRLAVGDCQDPSEAQAFAVSQANLTSLTLTFGSTADPTTNDLPDIGQVVRVNVQADADILGFFPMPGGGTVTRTVDSLVEDDVEGSGCP